MPTDRAYDVLGIEKAHDDYNAWLSVETPCLKIFRMLLVIFRMLLVIYGGEQLWLARDLSCCFQGAAELEELSGSWKACAFDQLDVPAMEEAINRLHKACYKMERGLQPNKLVPRFRNMVRGGEEQNDMARPFPYGGGSLMGGSFLARLRSDWYGGVAGGLLWAGQFAHGRAA